MRVEGNMLPLSVKIVFFFDFFVLSFAFGSFFVLMANQSVSSGDFLCLVIISFGLFLSFAITFLYFFIIAR